jgi:hypothetical protein
MDDPFTILGLTPQAQITPGELEAAYLAAARSAAAQDQHPDTLQAAHLAHRILSSPSRRLKALIEARCPDQPRTSLPLDPDLDPLFSALSSLVADATTLSRRLQDSRSQLSKALLAPRIVALRPRLEALSLEVQGHVDQALSSLPQLDTLWDRASPASWLARARSLHARLTFLERWQSQLRSLLGQLVF